MARFDLHRNGKGESFLLDCQADLLSDLNSRFVVPVLPQGAAPRPAERLNPVFEIEGIRYVMVTQYAGAVEARELGPIMASLVRHEREIGNALDFLITGV